MVKAAAKIRDIIISKRENHFEKVLNSGFRTRIPLPPEIAVGSPNASASKSK